VEILRQRAGAVEVESAGSRHDDLRPGVADGSKETILMRRQYDVTEL
jgi:hypothetical protein